jgi:hypothetical protein
MFFKVSKKYLPLKKKFVASQVNLFMAHSGSFNLDLDNGLTVILMVELTGAIESARPKSILQVTDFIGL